MEIVEFTPQFIDAVFEIQQKAYKPLYEKYRDGETSPYLENKELVLQKYTRAGTKGYVFIEDGVPVGAVRVALCPERKSGRISALGVLPEYQGQGIAQKALLKIEQIHSDVENWSLGTILEELRNCCFYEKAGYKKTGVTEKIKDGMTLVFYEKTVDKT